ncbi:MAG: hypothetical protein R3E39_05375 [Anaerolineae bacterium]
MPRQELELAKELINEKQYDKARMLLNKVKDDPTAQKWLEKLDELAPVHVEQQVPANGSGGGESSSWQYTALEVKRSYGIQYKVNGDARPEWKDQPIYYPLNLLGKDGWELIGFETANEAAVYILKRSGVGAVQKIDVWDQ